MASMGLFQDVEKIHGKRWEKTGNHQEIHFHDAGQSVALMCSCNHQLLATSKNLLMVNHGGNQEPPTVESQQSPTRSGYIHGVPNKKLIVFPHCFNSNDQLGRVWQVPPLWIPHMLGGQVMYLLTILE